MLLAEAVVNIKGEMSPLTRDLAKAKRDVSKGVASMQATMDKYGASIKKVGRQITIMGGAITAALTGIIYHTARLGDQFDKMSLRTGVAVEQLSALKHAVEIAGSDVTALETSFRFLSRRMDEADQGIGEAVDAFKFLDISINDASGQLRGHVDILLETADKVAALTNETKQTAIAMDIFGARSGPRLLPLLKQGGAGIKELMDRAKELGLVITAESAAAAAEFTDRMTELRSSLSMAAYQIGNTLLPALEPLVERLTEIVGQITNWTKEHPQLTSALTKFALVLGPMMAAGGMLLMLAPTLVKIAGTLTKFSGAATAATASLVALTASGWAFYRVYNALHKPLDAVQRDLNALNEVMPAQEAAIISINQALQAYESRGLDPTTATMGDLDLNLKALNNSLDSNIAETRNAEQMAAILSVRWGEATEKATRLMERLKGITRETEDVAGAMGGAGEATGKFTGFIEALFSPLDIVGRKIDELAFGAKNLRGALKEAMAFLPVAPPTAMPTGIVPKGRFDVVSKEAVLAAQKSEATIGFMKKQFDFLRRLSGLEEETAADRLMRWNAEEQAAVDRDRKLNILDDTREEERQAREAQRIDDANKLAIEIARIEGELAEGVEKEAEKAAKKLVDEQKKAAEVAKIPWEKFTGDVKYAFSDLFADMLTDLSTFGQAWDRFTTQLKDSFIRAIADILASKAVGAFKGLFTKKAPVKDIGGSIAGGIVGGIAKALGVSAGTLGVAVLGAAALAGVGYGIYKLTQDVSNSTREISNSARAIRDSMKPAWEESPYRRAQIAMERAGITRVPGMGGVTGAAGRPRRGAGRQGAGMTLGLRPRITGGEGRPGARSIIDEYQAGGILSGRSGLEGIFRRPRLAAISEGGRPEAVVPLKGGAIPVRLEGASGGMVIENVNVSFPNANLENMSQARFDLIFHKRILESMKNFTNAGYINPVMIG